MLKMKKSIDNTTNGTSATNGTNGTGIHNYEKVFAVLRESYYANPSPSVTLISNTKKTPYHILVSTLISLRTKDEVTLPASQRLFGFAESIEELDRLEESKISELIYPAGFYKTKAKQLKEIGRLILTEFKGRVPDTIEELLTLPGVGRKTANLVLILGFKQDSICVDIHVHRISNRLGWVKTKSPDDTEFALKELIPVKYWQMLNDYMVSYGQMVCRPTSPFCSKCGLSDVCAKVGVGRSR